MSSNSDPARRARFLLVPLLALFAAGSAEARPHRVAPGETLWSIAARELGDGSRWSEIARVNGIATPQELKVGALIEIPGADAGSETADADDPTAPAEEAAVEPLPPAPPPSSAHPPAPSAPPAAPRSVSRSAQAGGAGVAEEAGASQARRVSDARLKPGYLTSGELAGSPLTIERAVEIALRRAPEVAMAQAKIRAARAAIGVARADGLPQVTGTGDITRSETFKSTSALGVDEVTLGAGLSISQSLFTFGRLSSAINAATASEAAALAGAAQAEAEIGHGVRTAFLNLLLASRRVEVAEEALAVSTRLRDESMLREDAGTGTRLDVKRATADMAGRSAELSTARAEYGIARERLAVAMGLGPDAAFEVSGSLGELDQPIEPGPAVELALAERPELAVLSRQLEAAGYRLENARAQGFPSLDASASASYTRHDYISTSPFFKGQDASTGSFGLGLTVPIFNGFRVAESVKRSRAEIEELAARRERALLDARAAVRAIYHRLIAAVEKIDAAERSVAAAEEALRISELSFREGIVSSLDVIEAGLSLTQARHSLLAAEFEYRTGMADLVRAAGTSRVVAR